MSDFQLTTHAITDACCQIELARGLLNDSGEHQLVRKVEQALAIMRDVAVQFQFAKCAPAPTRPEGRAVEGLAVDRNVDAWGAVTVRARPGKGTP